jgi:hypothetical protein
MLATLKFLYLAEAEAGVRHMELIVAEVVQVATFTVHLHYYLLEL